MTSVDIQMMPAAVADFSKDSAISSKLACDLDSKLVMSSKQVFLQRIQFKQATKQDEQYENLKKKYTPLNVVPNQNGHDFNQSKMFSEQLLKSKGKEKKEDGIPAPKIVLFAPERIALNWKSARRVGPGLSNMGNTCFLNSVLQVLTYTAPLVNYLQTQEHTSKCAVVGFCMLCELQRHVLRAFTHNQNESIKPLTIIQKLKYIAKHLRFGHQEDSHEFLRYVIDGMQKSCLAGSSNKLDRFSKETTLVHQIFGGYYRSQVRCLRCQNTSNTYDPLMEIMLDIKFCKEKCDLDNILTGPKMIEAQFQHSPSVIRALHRFTKAEILDGENLYHCPRCKQKVSAQKQVTIHRPPNILTIQLKRFDYNQMFGGKISKNVEYSEVLDLRHFMSQKEGAPVKYKLYAVLVHSGYSANSGHYYCYIRAPSGVWYHMNDSMVHQVGPNTVLNQQAYLLFYQRIAKPTSEAVSGTMHMPKSPYSTAKSPFPDNKKVLFPSSKSPNTPKVIGKNDTGKPVTPVGNSVPVTKPVTPSATNIKPTSSTTATPLAPVSQRPKFSFSIPSKSKQQSQSPGAAIKEEKEMEKTPGNADSSSTLTGKGSPVSARVDSGQKTNNSSSGTLASSAVTPKEKLDENVEETKGEKFPLKKSDGDGRQEKEKSASPKKPKPPPLFIPRPVVNKGQTTVAVNTAPVKATSPWIVTTKVQTELKFGPMSPPPIGRAAPQQSPVSAMSDVSTSSSIMGPSGDWTVCEKAGDDSCITSRIPERQHVGWKVTLKVKESKQAEERKGESDSEKNQHKRKKKKKKHKKEKKTKIKNLDVSHLEEEEVIKKKKKKRKKEKRDKNRSSYKSDEEKLLDSKEKFKENKRKHKDQSDNSGESKRRLVDYSSDDTGSSQSSGSGKGITATCNGHSSKTANVRVWDESGANIKQRRATWDGSRDSLVVNELLSKGSGLRGYGSAVSSWDGCYSAVNDSEDQYQRNKKRERRDSWDEEYDKGKLKKVKPKEDKSKRRALNYNPFQRHHDYRKSDNKGFHHRFHKALHSPRGHSSYRSHGYRRVSSFSSAH